MKRVIKFGKKGKFSPCYVGPHQILRHFGNVAYELDLPSELALVHPVFNVSLLKKCIGDQTLVVPLESVSVKESLAYEDPQLKFLTIRSVLTLIIILVISAISDQLAASLVNPHLPEDNLYLSFSIGLSVSDILELARVSCQEVNLGSLVVLSIVPRLGSSLGV
ncbi:hypothetical protein MTR67_024226 [Solanum verrucosum]|uniref:Tf2-1-like SH3-like domain-containing protein n=1 Tax=Solanum verrucosum TaxID=315347 RepID=A0AAF0QWM3_SOLVR|nr:hypothetical protein MTR67_024226 [Solanum verrucosum]